MDVESLMALFSISLGARVRVEKSMMQTPPVSLKQTSPYWAVAVTLFFLVALIGIVQFPADSWVSGVTKNYLPIHVVLEFIGILVSFGITTVGFATYQNARSNDILILCAASFACAWLDMAHTLSFTGMPDFFGPSEPDKAIYFWLVSRYTGALCFLYIALSHARKSRAPHLQRSVLLIASAWVLFSSWIVLYERADLPVMFVPGMGLTSLKIAFEWGAVLISALASAIFFQRAQKKQNISFSWMGCACAVYAMCGYFFTLYQDFDDLYNFVGHIYKAIAFAVMYRAVFVECVSRPYEDVQRLAIEAASANASKSRFLANVSHEFRTPLGVISGFADLILSTPENLEQLGADQRRWTEMIERNARQLNLLIDDLLDLAKAETEKVSLSWSRFDLNALVHDVVMGLEPKAREKAVKLQTHALDDRARWVVSDEMRIRQIVTNILANAVKFTSEGQITITAKRIDGAVKKIVLEFQDTGIGISDEDAQKLFQPFSQVDNPLRRRFGGTGLGLAISKNLAHLLGGDLRLEKSIPEIGSLFSFSFRDSVEKAVVPITPPMQAEPVLRPAPPAAPKFDRAKILIAEDSPDNRVLLQHYLTPTHAQFEFAHNGREALELSRSGKYDLILMDIQMPEMDGFEATANLREEEWRGPIIALTAHALQPERERALSGGFDDYLVKPISRKTLWKALEEHLPEPQMPL